MIGNRIMAGIGISAIASAAVLGWLFLNARDNAQEAEQEAERLKSTLGVVLENERRSRELSDASEKILREWRDERTDIAAELTRTKKTLTEIRAAAREETDDEDLKCAVRPVPDSVDRLLRHRGED